jgi:hypothetical protein
MARISTAAFAKLQSEFPSYVTGDDQALSEPELLYAICTRQKDDMSAMRLVAEVSNTNPGDQQAVDALLPRVQEWLARKSVA